MEGSATVSDRGNGDSFELRSFIGFDLTTRQPGHAEATLVVRAEHHNPNGVVHGGVLFTMVDTAMGLATMSVLSPGEVCASIDVQIRYLHTITSGEVRVHAAVLRRGRRIVHLEARAFDSAGELASVATGTFAVVARDDGAAG